MHIGFLKNDGPLTKQWLLLNHFKTKRKKKRKNTHYALILYLIKVLFKVNDELFLIVKV